MTEEISKLVNMFINETNMDDIEVEEFNNHFYICTEARQIGEIKKINNEYNICLNDKYFKGSRYNLNGWS